MCSFLVHVSAGFISMIPCGSVRMYRFNPDDGLRWAIKKRADTSTGSAESVFWVWLIGDRASKMCDAITPKQCKEWKGAVSISVTVKYLMVSCDMQIVWQGFSVSRTPREDYLNTRGDLWPPFRRCTRNGLEGILRVKSNVVWGFSLAPKGMNLKEKTLWRF